MTQDNNEAASALHSAIMNLPCDESQAHGDPQTAYKYGHRDARHAAAELVSASASQSSTAGAAKGSTINTPDFRHLLSTYIGASATGRPAAFSALIEHIDNFAHVARQRQESAKAYCKACNDVGIMNCGNFDECDGPQCVTCHQKLPSRATPSAAVAEGVDTALPEPLTEVRAKFRGEWDYVEAGDNYYNMAKLQAYGAQQREAGRRERDAEIEAHMKRCDEMRDALYAMKQELEAALARQPVSEGLTEAQRIAVRDAVAESLTGVYYCGRVWSAWGVGTMSEDDFTLAAEDDGVLDGIVDAAIGALAVPPAKAEGISDTERLDFVISEECQIEALRKPGNFGYRVRWPWPEERTLEWSHNPRAAIDAAILAQQAKKGGAA